MIWGFGLVLSLGVGTGVTGAFLIGGCGCLLVTLCCRLRCLSWLLGVIVVSVLWVGGVSCVDWFGGAVWFLVWFHSCLLADWLVLF